MSETYVSHTKPGKRMQSLSESRGGSKVTKPIFSNSRKRHKSTNASLQVILEFVFFLLFQKNGSVRRWETNGDGLCQKLGLVGQR